MFRNDAGVNPGGRQIEWKQRLHLHIWQRIPRQLRRSALFNATAWLAPRPTAGAAARWPIIVVGSLRTASGLGEGARLCHEALLRRGHDVYGIDLSSKFRQPGPAVPFSFRDGRSMEGAGTIILHVNAPFVPLALMYLGKRLVANKRLVGYWAWELPAVPPEWCFGLPFVHEVWVPSRFTADAIAAVAGEVPIRVVPHPVAARQIAKVRTGRSEQGRFTALVVFNMASGFTRKNPVAAIRAFRQAFDDDPSCRLIVRVVNANLYPEGFRLLTAAAASQSNIVISHAEFTETSVDDLYASADVVLSLHRSEGFGLVVAEAMLHGLPVLATNWSGNVDFLTSVNGLPVSYAPVPATDPQGTYDQPTQIWAEADTADAALKLRSLRDDPNMRKALGRQAQLEAAALFGVEKFEQNVMKALNL